MSLNLDLSHFDRQSLSDGCCKAYAEAASVVMKRQGHTSPVPGKIQGDHRIECVVTSLDVDDAMNRTHSDIQDATEAAAYGMAIWSLPHISDYECWERSQKGPGFDFWLKEKSAKDQEGDLDELNFLGGYDARLEVSGIASGPGKVGARIKAKLKQLGPSDDSGKPGFVFIAEFSGMIFHFQQKVTV